MGLRGFNNYRRLDQLSRQRNWWWKNIFLAVCWWNGQQKKFRSGLNL